MIKLKIQSPFMLLPFFAAILGLLFVACDVFTPGLGDKVDIEQPVVSLDNREANFYFHGTMLLSGTVSDDQGVDSVTVYYTDRSGNKRSALATLSTASEKEIDGDKAYVSTWSLSLASGGSLSTQLAEGDQTLTITAQDKSGRTYSITTACRVDNNAPVVLVTSPLTYTASGGSSSYNKYVDIKGEAWDEYGIESLTIQVYDQSKKALSSAFSVDGTKSWSSRLLLSSSGSTLQSYLQDDERYYYLVRASDAAGNTSSVYFHRNDFYTMIPNLETFPTIEEIGLAWRGSPKSGSKLSKSLLSSYQLGLSKTNLADFTYTSSYQPSVTWTTLYADRKNDSDPRNELPSNMPISGSISPATNGAALDSSTVKVLLYEQDGANPISTLTDTVSSPSGSDADKADGLSISSSGDSLAFTIYLWDPNDNDSWLESGSYRLRLIAEDEEGVSVPEEEVEFLITNGYPTLDIDSPSDNQTWTGSASDESIFTLKGSVSSYAVDYLSLSLDDTVQTGISGSAELASWSWTMSGALFASLDEGWHTLEISALEADETWRFFKDTEGPVITVIYPSSGTTHNGSVTIRGSIEENNTIAAVEYHIGSSGSWTDLGTNFSWNIAIPDLAIYANSTYASETETDSGVWILPIQFRASDGAGNSTVKTNYSIKVDPAGDQPVLSLMYPYYDGDDEPLILGGQIRVYGTAIDDDSLYDVQFQLDVNNDGDYEDKVDFWDGNTDDPGLAADGDTSDLWEDESVIHTASGTSS